MATHATQTAGPGVMVQRRGRGDLSALRHSLPDLMALVASELLMLAMIEAHAKSLRVFGSATVAAGLVTRAARGDIPSLGLCARSVTSKAS